ncbi:MAK10-like protein, partial [Tanacetum coccineum]
LDLNVENRERTRLHLFQFSLRDQASNWLERLPAGSISTWEDLTTRFLAQFFPPGRIAKLRNDNLMFQKHQGASLSEDPFTFRERIGPYPQPKVLETTFEARVWDYMVAHAERMERFENAIFRQREAINDRMTKMFGLLNELATSRAPKKVLIREEARHPITKDVNSISLVLAEEKSNAVNNEAITENTMEPSKHKKEEPLKKVCLTNKVRRREGGEPAKKVKEIATKNEGEDPAEVNRYGWLGWDGTRISRTTTRSDANVMPFSTYNKLTNERLAETKIRLSLASYSYIYPLRIAKNVLVDVAGYVYPVDLVIMDIKEDERRLFILGTPFLTIAKAVIKFDKGTITLKSEKSKISFQRIPGPKDTIEKGVKNDIEPIAPIMTVNRKQLMRLRAGKFSLKKRIGISLRVWRRRLGSTDIAKITRKRSKPDKHGHGNGKSAQEPGV